VPGEYAWSSYRCNALGIQSSLCTPHAEYLALGVSEEARRRAYQGLFESELAPRVVGRIRAAVNRGVALGDTSFREEIEALEGKRITPQRQSLMLGSED
jgi:putative transposase